MLCPNGGLIYVINLIAGRYKQLVTMVPSQERYSFEIPAVQRLVRLFNVFIGGPKSSLAGSRAQFSSAEFNSVVIDIKGVIQLYRPYFRSARFSIEYISVSEDDLDAVDSSEVSI
jgi:hypothetical protein